MGQAEGQVVWELLAQVGTESRTAPALVGYVAAHSLLRPAWIDLRGRVARRPGAPAG